MDKNSNSKIQFRLPNDLSEDFKIACQHLDVKPSEKLRDLMCDFLDDYDVIDKIYDVIYRTFDESNVSNELSIETINDIDRHTRIEAQKVVKSIS